MMGYVFGLKGIVSMSETACSASNVAWNLAYQQLRRRRDAHKHGFRKDSTTHTNQALTMGINFIDNPLPFIGLSQAHMLGVMGRSMTYDMSANGFCRGEGVGAGL